MEAKPIYSLFPQPLSPATPTPAAHHSRRHSRDRKTRTSLDPLPPIEEPPDLPPPASETAIPDSPVLKPIHSLYNPQPARPSSRRGAAERQERRRSLNRQLQPSSQNPSPPRQGDSPPDSSAPLDSAQQGSSLSRTSSLKDASTSSQQPTGAATDSPPRPSTAQGMYVGGPSLSLRAQVPTPSTNSSVSLTKPPLLSPTSTVVSNKPFANSASNQVQYNKTPYFHGGIGGRGNYRKVKRDDKTAPLAYAPNAVPLNGRSTFLSNIFGGRGRRKRSPSHKDRCDGHSSEDSLSGGGSGASSEREEVALGAAEVMRRKLLKQAGVRPHRRAEAWERK